MEATVAQSPELAGGAGFTFEDAVAGSYLTALLQQGYAPGVESRVVTRVALQQRDFGEPLDDIIVDFRSEAGEPARLRLQVKRSLTISRARTNIDFRDIIRDCWATLSKPDFRRAVDRYGAAAGEVASGKARDLRTLCELARASATSADFEARFAAGGNVSEAVREVRDDVVALIEETTEAPSSVDGIHQFLAHFVLIEYDFMHEGGTSLPSALNSLQLCLAPGHAGQAPALWTKLCRLAREGAGRSAVFDRPHLVRELATEVSLASPPSIRSQVENITNLTRQWLTDIEDSIGGTRLDRPALAAMLREKLATYKLVQLRGLPGSGKSVVLRRRVEPELEQGPVVLLKAGRLEGIGWVGFANALGFAGAPLVDLLVEIAATGSPTLYIDGVDRIEKQHRPIIRDVVGAVLSSPLLDNWKIVLSLRDTGIEPLRNWLGDFLSTTSIGTLDVGALDDEEAAELGKAKPHLRGLLFGPKQVREIVRRPFFAKVLNQNFTFTAGDAAFAPQSEVDLIGNWWARGGYDSDGQAATVRQQAIIELGTLRARHLEREIAIRQLSPGTVGIVDQLVSDGILQHALRGHTLRFSHDIFFEWAFFHVLVDCGSAWLEEIRACGEPPTVARVVELLSQWEFERGSDWASILQEVDASQMRSQWTRSWLLAPLTASNFDQSEATYSDTVQADDFRFLKKALVWFQAERTTPNSNVLAADLPADQRIRFADLLGWPADFPTWARFINFLMKRIEAIPVTLYPDIVSLFEVWQNALAGHRNHVSSALLELADFWLQKEEPVRQPRPAPSRWAVLGSDLDDFGKRLTVLILRSAICEPALVRGYLTRVIASERLSDEKFTEVVSHSPMLAQSHPDLLVDLTLKHLMGELPQDSEDRQREEERAAAEYLRRIRAKPPEQRTKMEELALSSSMPIIGLDSVSSQDWESLSVDRDHQNYWPPSPLREPFHSLFKVAPDQALRLVVELSNHAMTAWRQLHRLDPERPGTPVPLKINFPWGSQQFWGGDREYLWHRGMQAPPVVACAYMALEDWAFQELERERPLDRLIQHIVAGNECIAVLGIAVAIALQAQQTDEAVFPLVTSQRLLAADHNRMLQDFASSSANLVGFRDKSELPHVEAIKAANARPVRKKELSWLISVFFLQGAKDLSDRTKQAVLNFTQELPFQLEEHRNIKEALEYLTQQANEYAELVDIAAYRRVPSPDEKQITVVHVSPSGSTPERVARAEEAGQRLMESNLWVWASKYLQAGEAGTNFTVSTAIEFAKKIDGPSLYEPAQGDQVEIDMRRGAVAATAALALRYREDIPVSDLRWARDVLRRALHTPETHDPFWSPSSIMPWHQAIFVAAGLADDLRHGTADHDAAGSLLALVAHPLELVALAALKECLSLWDQDPKLGWSALFMALSLCSIPRRRQPLGPSDPLHSHIETKAALESALRVYNGADPWPELPLPPPAWVKIKKSSQQPDLGDQFEREFDNNDKIDAEETWAASPTYWHSTYASKILALVPYESVLASEAKDRFITLLSGQLAWTIATLTPPLTKKRRRNDDSPFIFKWTHELGRTLGRIAGHCTLMEVTARFFEPIFALEGEHCWELLSPLMHTYVCVHVYDAAHVPDDAIQLLSACLERFLRDRAFDPTSYRAGELTGFDQPRLAEALMFVSVEHAALATRYVNGDWSDIDRIIPIVDRFVRFAGWAYVVMSHYLTLCERSKDAFPAEQFADQVLHVIDDNGNLLKGWHGTSLPARIAGLVQYLVDRETPAPATLAQKFLRILDLLVDMGDRRSAALQLSEAFREIQTN
jgi:hypothetical protein